jgi:murein L,D-transpeptidase YcbB/YkuD
VNEYAGNFLNLLNQQRGGEQEQQQIERLEKLYSQMVDNVALSCGDTLLRDMEILLSASFFDYARRNWGGMSDDVRKRVGWFIVRKRMDHAQLLEDFLEKGEDIEEPPVYRQYKLLRHWLQNYAAIEESGEWPALTRQELEALTPGDSSAAAQKLRNLLRLTGDLETQGNGTLFDASMARGLVAFQQRHGLDTTGLADEKTITELVIPLHERIQQIIINMERCRWVPSEVRGSYVVVNIPQFRLHVYENDELLWSCNVIVGKSNAINKTVIFND